MEKVEKKNISVNKKNSKENVVTFLLMETIYTYIYSKGLYTVLNLGYVS